MTGDELAYAPERTHRTKKFYFYLFIFLRDTLALPDNQTNV